MDIWVNGVYHKASAEFLAARAAYDMSVERHEGAIFDAYNLPESEVAAAVAEARKEMDMAARAYEAALNAENERLCSVA